MSVGYEKINTNSIAGTVTQSDSNDVYRSQRDTAAQSDLVARCYLLSMSYQLVAKRYLMDLMQDLVYTHNLMGTCYLTRGHVLSHGYMLLSCGYALTGTVGTCQFVELLILLFNKIFYNYRR